jgi:glucose/arabinose dehydrogenase
MTSAHRIIVAIVLASFAGLVRAGVTLPPGFVVEEMARGLTGATAMTVAPDGRLFICEQTGDLRVWNEGRLLPTPFLSLKVDSYWERGLIGVALDPEFEKNGFVYVTYVAPKPYPHHVISRFTADGDVAAMGSEVILLKGDNQQKMGGTVKAGHQGGAMHFGHDGKLYISIGEQTSNLPAQDLDTFLGKILRINKDGTIPEDNPFCSETEGKYRAIYALGCRNVFCFAVRPGTGQLYLNDVGGATEEINVLSKPGQNFGWPLAEHGTRSKGRFTDAIHAYPFSSITGGAFCPQNNWPAEYHGKYFFVDFMKGWMKILDPEDPKRVTDFAAGFPRPTEIRFGPDGCLYVLNRDAWVIDNKFTKGTGTLVRVRFIGK